MKYKIAVSSKFDNRIYNGEFEAESKEQAIKDCQEFYALELDTIPSEVEILEVN
jgi:hypothetical protein